MRYRWNRPGSLALPATAPTWGLTLDLMTSSNRRRGSMNVHRLYQDHPLQLDVNILISEFPVALANALDRVIEHAVARVPLSKGDNGLVEAQSRKQISPSTSPPH